MIGALCGLGDLCGSNPDAVLRSGVLAIADLPLSVVADTVLPSTWANSTADVVLHVQPTKAIDGHQGPETPELTEAPAKREE